MSHLLQVPCQQLRVRATLLKTVPSSRLTKPKPFGGPRTCSKPLSAKRTRLDLRRRLRLKSLPLLRKTPSLEPSRTGNHWPLNSVKNILDISSAHEALNKAACMGLPDVAIVCCCIHSGFFGRVFDELVHISL